MELITRPLYALALAASLLSCQSGSKAGNNGPEPGQSAPEFQALDQYGNLVTSSDLLQKGPVVLIFYRGQWCPVCSRHLSQMQDSLQMILKAGAQLIAVAPEKQEYAQESMQKSGAEFPILYDEGYTIMNQFGVAFEVSGAKKAFYKVYHGSDLSEEHGTPLAQQLPIPATYIIGSDGTILYKHYNPNFKERASVAEILRALN